MAINASRVWDDIQAELRAEVIAPSVVRETWRAAEPVTSQSAGFGRVRVP